MFPTLSDESLRSRLAWPEGRVRMVLDTDTYNEVDDQFALCHALLSPDRLQVDAIYAAPFHNNRSAGAEDGMEKSYEEILRLLGMLGVEDDGFVFRGSREYISSAARPPRSEAVTDLIERASASSEDDPLYVVAIGAITNVSAAILAEPSIIEKIVIVWLGGADVHRGSAREFNLGQDLIASQTVFDCGVPLVHIPCRNVTSHLHTTIPELEHYLGGQGRLCDYLVDIVKGYVSDAGRYGWSKVIWDISATAYLINGDWVPTHLAPSPVLTDDFRWAVGADRHTIRAATYVKRDPIFRDVFTKLTAVD
ncbi:nucleoside hydrolase [Candidatus Poribacteria bacterium]|jgi:purine nucleosidase|nr:nucleoside hydrolase [Candidatus Poribacteria bacterium]MBT5532540.1 nucleoside hydrolase [Candidatus Poribacteria bacterium]MBT5713931.1 nucleoside hydrolase [Candidatus Poribacteria bacterium]MBT7098554.1 nucleoside hydrolase [Candidatus Poribacteria bacterium]MBT7808705.1 nucleoside hydrolase [Candidatus Poribacteria bacterium]